MPNYEIHEEVWHNYECLSCGEKWAACLPGCECCGEETRLAHPECFHCGADEESQVFLDKARLKVKKVLPLKYLVFPADEFEHSVLGET